MVYLVNTTPTQNTLAMNTYDLKKNAAKICGKPDINDPARRHDAVCQIRHLDGLDYNTEIEESRVDKYWSDADDAAITAPLLVIIGDIDISHDGCPNTAEEAAACYAAAAIRNIANALREATYAPSPGDMDAADADRDAILCAAGADLAEKVCTWCDSVGGYEANDLLAEFPSRPTEGWEFWLGAESARLIRILETIAEA